MFLSLYRYSVHYYYLNILFLNKFVMNAFIILILLNFISCFCSLTCLAGGENTDMILKEIEDNRLANENKRKAQMLISDMDFKKKFSDRVIRCEVVNKNSIDLLNVIDFPWKDVSVEVVPEVVPEKLPVSIHSERDGYNKVSPINKDIPYSLNFFVHGGLYAFTGLGVTTFVFEKAVNSRVINGTIMYNLPFNRLASAPTVGKIGLVLGAGVFLGGVALSDLDVLSSLITK